MIDLSKNQRSINTSGAHVDGGDVEALGAHFERGHPDHGLTHCRVNPAEYDDPFASTAWRAYQAGHAAAKAETAAAVAKERERAATVVDEKIGSVCKANPGRGGRINSAVAFVLDALRDCADAIRAGAKEHGE